MNRCDVDRISRKESRIYGTEDVTRTDRSWILLSDVAGEFKKDYALLVFL